MHCHEAPTNDQLGFGGDEPGPSGGFLPAPENPGNTVRLGEECSVDDAETKADGSPLDPAHRVCGSEHKEEGNGVAEKDSGQ